LFGFNLRKSGGVVLLSRSPLHLNQAAQIPVVAQANATVRVMAANLTSGNDQLYEVPGVPILEGMKADIVAIQELNHGGKPSSVAQIRSFVDLAFDTNFHCFPRSRLRLHHP